MVQGRGDGKNRRYMEDLFIKWAEAHKFLNVLYKLAIWCQSGGYRAMLNRA
jgi:hypothetical protein